MQASIKLITFNPILPHTCFVTDGGDSIRLKVADTKYVNTLVSIKLKHGYIFMEDFCLRLYPKKIKPNKREKKPKKMLHGC